jgi:hypothetical protein
MNSQHLIRDELLMAVVDAADLAADKRAHLEACPICHGAQARLAENFLHLGRKARNLAPSPARPFRLPAAQTAATRRRIKPLWAIGLATAMLLAILLGRSLWPSFSQEPVPTAAALEADRRLGEAVDALVEDALPVSFQRLASLDEDEDEVAPDLDEDLMDWVVPPIEENDGSMT